MFIIISTKIKNKIYFKSKSIYNVYNDYLKIQITNTISFYSHTYKHLVTIRIGLVEKSCLVVKFIIQSFEINGIFVWRIGKGFRFNTLITPLNQFILESAEFDHLSVYASTC